MSDPGGAIAGETARGASRTPGRVPVIEPTLRELTAAAKHAADRLALYRRRVYVGRGNLPRLAELTRIAEGAAERLAKAKDATARAAGRRPRS